MKYILGIFMGILVIVLSFIIVFGFIYLIFWSFGPNIFGFTFNYFLVIFVWIIVLFVHEYFYRKGF